MSPRAGRCIPRPSRASAPVLACGLLALAFAAPTMAAPAVSSPVRPGYWESTETYSVLLGGTNHDRKCLTAEQISQFLAAPGTKHYRCTYEHREIADGQARYSGGACYSHKGRKVLSDVGITGGYAPDRFHLDFQFHLMLSSGVGFPGVAAIDAHRLSAECPADLPPGK